MSHETVPDLLLERLALDELPEDEAAALRARVAGDAVLEERLGRIVRDNRLALAEMWPVALAGRVRRARVPAHETRRPPVLWLGLAAAAVAGAVFLPRVLAPAVRPGALPATPAAEEIRHKGLGPRLRLFRKTKEGSETLADGALCRPGDLIRVSYHAEGQVYGAILSVDGRGAVTLHLPTRGTQAVALRSGEAVLLDQAYELDDAPRFECFYLVTGAAPFDLEPVRTAVARAAQGAGPAPPHALSLPPGLGLEQSAVALQKGSLR